MSDLATQIKEHKEILDAQGNAFNDLKTVIERYDEESSDRKAYVEEIGKKFDKLEQENNELITNFKAKEEAEKDLKERLEAMEAKLARPGMGADQKAIDRELAKKAFNIYCKYGANTQEAHDHLKEIEKEKKYLRTDSNIDGGYLLEMDFVQEIIKDITEISPIRSIARVRTTNRKTVVVPRRTNLVASGWNGEGLDRTDTNSQYALEEATLGKLSVVTHITNEEVMDASFDMENEVRMDVAEEFARAEGAAFVSGNSVNQPEGFLVNSDVESFNTTSANVVDADDLINITGQLKDGYDPVFVLNRRSLATIRQLKDGNGQYLWAPGIAAGLPNTIIGEPYVSAIDMPDIATGQSPVAYGDFRRGYWIVDRMAMTMIRDMFTLGARDMIRLIFHKRLTGQVIKAEAIKKLTVA